MPEENDQNSQQEPDSPDSKQLDLSEEEEADIGERKRDSPRPAILHEAIRLEGEEELQRQNPALIWSSLAAGLSMGFSLVAKGLLHAYLPNAEWRSLITSLGYTVGFIIVIFGRQQLYTETTLTVVLPLLSHFRTSTLLRVMKYWLIVLSSNLLGTMVFAWIMAKTRTFSPEVQSAFVSIAVSAAEGGFWITFLRGVFAGWLIALMTWLIPGAGSSKLTIVIIFTYLVALGSLSHVIAGSAEVFYGVMEGSLTWQKYGGYLLASFLGNTLGGVSLVALLNSAQVAPKQD